jgi:hypothetical protein
MEERGKEYRQKEGMKEWGERIGQTRRRGSKEGEMSNSVEDR